jgi:diaminohydroxyphosphoribosylaminopyrimidine deaminase / 5-amino-6-(5-phosphoribosylamino)uracil reductase
LAKVAVSSQLVRTAREFPVLIAVSSAAPQDRCEALRQLGCEVFVCVGEPHADRLRSLLSEMGRRRWTNVLLECGGRLLGEAFDHRLINEAHVFIAPKLSGGAGASSPIGGKGVATMSEALQLRDATWREVNGDLYLSGRLPRDV